MVARSPVEIERGNAEAAGGKMGPPSPSLPLIPKSTPSPSELKDGEIEEKTSEYKEVISDWDDLSGYSKNKIPRIELEKAGQG